VLKLWQDKTMCFERLIAKAGNTMKDVAVCVAEQACHAILIKTP